jgi:hypothetical protein
MSRGVLSKIVDCVRTAFGPCASDDPRGRMFVRAGFRKTCALRAPTVFSARMKSASTQKTRLWLTPRAARI